LGEERSPSERKTFEIGDLVRLNEELKQLREVLRRKRAQRDQAKRAGRKLQVDLTPEIERLGRFLQEIDRVSLGLKGTHLRSAGSKLGETVALDDALTKVKAELENEKAKLEAERAAREEEKLRHEQELNQLRDEYQKSKELLNTDQRSVETVVTKTIEQSEKLQPELANEETHKPTVSGIQLSFSTSGIITERPLATTPIETTEPTKVTEGKETRIEPKTGEKQQVAEKLDRRVEVANEIRDEMREQARQNEALRRDIQSKVRDEFTAIRYELQSLREQISREQATLDAKRQDLDLERRKLEEERRILEARIADTLTASRSELDRVREQIAQRQEQLEARQKTLYDERVKLDEGKRLLRERAGEIENERLRFNAHKIVEELENERSELAGLKRSLQQLRAESARDRRRLEEDRESILRARVTLENEKRKTAWKNALLEIKTRQALLRQKPLKKAEKSTEQPAASPEEKTENIAKVVPVPTTTTEENAVVLGVRLGEESYGIDISRVREIMKPQVITPVPRQPPYVEGVMNVRGVIIPVINLRRRFGLKGEPTTDPHTVIVDSAEGMVGILVDSVSEVIRLPPEKIHPPPALASGLEGEYLRGICRVGDQLLLYLDVEKILRRATPISTLQAQLQPLRAAGKPKLSQDEQRLLKAIPPGGILKSRLQKRTKFGDTRLQTNIRSLARKGLVTTFKDGNRRLIARIQRPPLPRQTR
jgi:purine-binding chemotaxis protein CheW